VKVLIPAVALLVTGAAAALELPRAQIAIHTAAGVVQYFEVELAATAPARTRGLMHRRHLPARAGMLFDFQTEQPVSMWMRNTHIPLDMLFIRADGTIAAIAAHTRPHSLERIESDQPVRMVLELNAGTAEALDIRTGDRVSHPSRARAAPVSRPAARAGRR